jgi:hypothetical protein
MNIGDSVTISYLKGEISFSDYANIIENQNLKNEFSGESVIEYATPQPQPQPTSSTQSAIEHTEQKSKRSIDKIPSLNNYFDSDDDMDEEIWKDFDIGTLNFDKFIDGNSKGATHDEPSTSASSRSTQPSTGLRKQKKKLKSEDEADVKSKRRVSETF